MRPLSLLPSSCRPEHVPPPTSFLLTRGNSLKSFTSCFLAWPQASGRTAYWHTWARNTKVPKNEFSHKKKRQRSGGNFQMRKMYSFGKSLNCYEQEVLELVEIAWEHVAKMQLRNLTKTKVSQRRLCPSHVQMFTVSTPSEPCPTCFHSLATVKKKKRHFLEGLNENYLRKVTVRNTVLFTAI